MIPCLTVLELQISFNFITQIQFACYGQKGGLSSNLVIYLKDLKNHVVVANNKVKSEPDQPHTAAIHQHMTKSG